MARIDFERHLSEIQEDMLVLAGMVERAIDRSITALKGRDTELARVVIVEDMDINRKRYETEEKCLELLATQQPMARDLRTIVAVLHIIVDLERMGDHAEGIAKIAIMLADEAPLKPYIDIPRMAEAAQKMLKDSLDSFVARDADLAISVCTADDFVDNLNQQIFNELLVYMLKDPKNISRAVRLTYITKYLERIADHATNIAEMVVFMVKGKVIRHTACEARKDGRHP
jgi:phosphate transport system protein